jgi:hypothetical protein
MTVERLLQILLIIHEYFQNNPMEDTIGSGNAYPSGPSEDTCSLLVESVLLNLLFSFYCFVDNFFSFCLSFVTWLLDYLPFIDLHVRLHVSIYLYYFPDDDFLNKGKLQQVFYGFYTDIFLYFSCCHQCDYYVYYKLSIFMLLTF